MEGKEKAVAQNLLASSPLVPKIVAYKTSRDFKAPSHTTYDGTSNLGEHLVSVQAKMMMVGPTVVPILATPVD